MRSKWPKEVDQMIKKLCDKKKTKWSSIVSIINDKFD